MLLRSYNAHIPLQEKTILPKTLILLLLRNLQVHMSSVYILYHIYFFLCIALSKKKINLCSYYGSDDCSIYALILLFYFVELGFELKASCFLGRHSTT
jgi:hypothetical protein